MRNNRRPAKSILPGRYVQNHIPRATHRQGVRRLVYNKATRNQDAAVMKQTKTCKVCHIPLRVGKDHLWGPDGTITLRGIHDRRMVFFDSDGLDVLFSNIESLLGISVEKILIESKARSAREYARRMLRGPKGQLARLVGLNRVVGRVLLQGRILGYGRAGVSGFSWREGYISVEIEDPYSLPLFCADFRGAAESVTRDPGTVTSEELGPGRYRVDVARGSSSPEFAGRLLPQPRARKPGDVTYNYCPRCGVPLEVSRFIWDLDRGTITHADSGLRMALFGPQGLEVFFNELEGELGDTIPETVIEAQRMYAESRMSLRSIGARAGDVRSWLAIRGLGNLVSLDITEELLEARIENPSLPLVIVGTSLSFYEFTFNRKGRMEWSLADDGDLRMRISPA